MNTITVIQHNVLKWTSVRANELFNIYNALNPDVLLLNSTGRKENERIKIFGFNVHQRNIRNEDSAGIAVAIKKNIIYKIIDEAIQDIMAIEIETTTGPIVIGTSYVPPRSNEFPVQELTSLMRLNKPMYFMGDLNAHFGDAGYSRKNRNGRILNNLIQRNLASYLGPEFKTWIHPTNTGTPDIILGNRKIHLNVSITQGPVTTSDHIPIIVKISTKPIMTPSKKHLQIKKADWAKFKSSILENEKEAKIDINDRNITKEIIDEKLIKWQSIVKEAIKEAIPEAKNKILPHPRSTDRQNILQRAYEQLRTIGERQGWTMAQRNLFKTIQNQLTNECIQNYHKNWENLIKNIDLQKNDPKQFWSSIRRLMGGKEETTPFLKDNRGQKCYKDEEKEKLFREIWQDIFRISNQENQNFCQQKEEEVKAFLDQNRHRLTPYKEASMDRLNPHCEFTKPVETFQIKLIIKNFKDKVPGESGLRKSILEQIPTNMYDNMKNIINLSLSMGYYPDPYKGATLCMMQKAGKDPTHLINYRPISLLEVMGKVFERIITDRLIKFLNTNNIMNPDQFGFHKSRGTQSALALLYEKVAISQKQHYQCNIVCRDIKKAFDKVWHDGLRYKILNINLPDIIEKITCNYITNRTASIRVGSTLGPPIPLMSGVPQGSILSPTLFNFYTHDIPRPSPGCFNIVFADDCTQLVTDPGKSKRFLARKTEREIEKLNLYEKQWKISTNKNKFQIISVSATKPATIMVDNQVIPFKASATVLGLTIRTRGILNHITSRIGRAKGQLQKLKRLKKE